MTDLTLFNTLHRQKSLFKPLREGSVSLYTCGPTVYNYVHIGNLRTYIFEDLLVRTLIHCGYQVKHVMNVTDVGHLESDADEGEDKMNRAAEREKKDVWAIAKFYEEAFFKDCQKLNLIPPNIICRATEHIEDMIAMIQQLESKGYTYNVDGNVYFDISKFPDYSKFAKLDLEAMQSGSRVEVDQRKRNAADFVLWFSQSKFPNQIMKWESPWGIGFPGWHIECSAMATKYLGENIDIHCGGIDHIPVHHTNEIAQSECALGQPWVQCWLHGEFLILDKEKMSKSSGKFLTLENFCKRGFQPLHYRWFCLGAHYRTQLTFTWEAAEAAKTACENLFQRILSWKNIPGKVDAKAVEDYQEKFREALYDDLNLPVVLAIVWEVARHNKLKEPTKREILYHFDSVLGMNLKDIQKPQLTQNQFDLIEKRNDARKNKDWKTSDEIRDTLKDQGVVLQDTPQGTEWYLDYSK